MPWKGDEDGNIPDRIEAGAEAKIQRKARSEWLFNAGTIDRCCSI